MKYQSLRLGVILWALGSTVVPAGAGQAILVTRNGQGLWQVLEVEKIAINGKSKVRTGSGVSRNIQPAEYKKMVAVEVLRAGILRRHEAGYLVRKEGGKWEPIAPDGAALKVAASYAELWSAATFAVQQDAKAKDMTAVKTEDVFAMLPGEDRNEAVVDFLADEGNFRGVGEADDEAAFNERMSLVIGAAGFVTGPAEAKLKGLILSQMETAEQRLNAGLAHYRDLENGLRYVQISQKAWPGDAQQKAARDVLLANKAWLDQRMAILKAFYAGRLWDAFLDKYGEFRRYDNSFEAMRKMRENAVLESTRQHRNEGQRRYEAKQYTLALAEFKLAHLRNPGDKEINDKIDEVSSTEERETPKPKPFDPKDPRQMRITRYLASAKTYIDNKRWKDAEEEIKQCEALDRKSYRILYTRALLLEAQGKLLEARNVLDQYAKLVSADEDVNLGEALRGKISSELSLEREKRKSEVAKFENEGDYPRARDSAQAGVALDPTDLYFLLHAASNNAIMRNRDLARQQYESYIQLSQNSGGDEKELAKVYGYQRFLEAEPAASAGRPNWYSGYKSPPGLFYCPISLMPNVQIVDIKGSHKERTSFRWNGNQLAQVTTQDEEAGARDFSLYFDYFKDTGIVRRIAETPFADKDTPAAPRFTVNGTAAEGSGAYVALLNYPTVDPFMIERLTDRRVATIVAGNMYFHPFVWKGIYRFLAGYDDRGRVNSATLLAESGKPPFILDFQWDGLRLIEISERGGQGYRRTLNYSGERLVSETISFRGKTSKIKYTYKDNQLAEAECDEDASIDGRSRRVTFR
ncbi:MAG TPA: hypothetical protein VMI94_25955 [Bryobacteraceae bacterium]|nr:hypothetical protein [Bryobacteraceae bacterium]